MEEKNKKYHLDTLSAHKQNLYRRLLYEHNVQSKTLKIVEFGMQSKDEKTEAIRGYFLIKNNKKYFINEEAYSDLPIEVEKEECDELVHSEDIVVRPLSYTPFKILPEKTMSVKELVDDLAPFKHSNPDNWRMAKINAIAGYVGKTFTCVSSISSFGKTSIFNILDSLTDKCPNFKPRSVPGVLNQITGDGNIVFDEAQEAKKEVKDIMEEFSLDIGGNKPVYINGALKSSRTKQEYPCPTQSITYLFNNTGNYKSPETDYFEYIFSNNKAIDNRFLKLKFDGELTEVFDRKFSIEDTAKQNESYYIKITKMLAYLKELKENNKYVRRYTRNKPLIVLTGRRKQVYDEISWIIDQYSDCQEEYDGLCDTLERAVLDYKLMISQLEACNDLLVKEEVVK